MSNIQPGAESENRTDCRTITAKEIAKEIRLDIYLCENEALCSRSQLKTRVRDITVNGKPVKLGKKIKPGDVIKLVYQEPVPVSLVPEPMDLRIIYEDDDIIVVNKPCGLVVHPGAGNPTGTLVNGLLAHCGNISENFNSTNVQPESALRPGIVHRLDKDTSGVILAAKHHASLEYCAAQFRKRRTKKFYLAIVAGKLASRTGTITTSFARDRWDRKRFACALIDPGRPFHGKIATTRYRVIREWDRGSLVALYPQTGRTHQLRVHMKFLDNPVFGDVLYNKKKDYANMGLMLHAYRLRIKIPGTGKLMLFTAPMPKRFRLLIDILAGKSTASRL
ncbi:MAG: RluA family pseudouridine synthase [Spirochaetaceae bacterium]|nr:MAG: RluA family pseudouridine synthase [Spirochaetaceae bacterium]